MEDSNLREKFNSAVNAFVEKIRKNKKCVAAFLMGSAGHDLIWEHSDLHVMLVVDDGFKGSGGYILERDVPMIVTAVKKSEFIKYLNSGNVSDHNYCDLYKSAVQHGGILFNNDPTLNEYLEDMAYIGDTDKEIEMLLAFSCAVWRLNKAEKNFRVKNNFDNALFFLLQIPEDIARIEVIRRKIIPEREIIAQAREFNPEIFEKIYDCFFNGKVTDETVNGAIDSVHEYLKENTLEIYRPVISYIEKHGSLEGFSMPERNHGFGINFEWLRRMGIADIYTEPAKLDNQSGFDKIGYKLMSSSFETAGYR